MRIIKQILIILILQKIVITSLFAESTTKEIDISSILREKFKRDRVTLLKHLSNKKFLKKFYKKNRYSTIWIDNNLKLKKEKYKILFSYIKNDLTLNSNGYILKKTEMLKRELDTNITKEQLFRMEVQLTSLYYEFLKHSIYGEVEWKDFEIKLYNLKRHRINSTWVRKKPNFNLNTLLTNPNINETLKSIEPKRFGYIKLFQGLKKLQDIKKAGGWKKLPYFKVLKLGSSGEIVIKLRERLKASGDYLFVEENSSKTSLLRVENNISSEEPYIDPDAIFGIHLDDAVKHFQKRHGLTVDGIVGGATQKALNESVEDKIERVLLNIDRIKWLPRNNENRYLVVNIPEFMLYYIEDNIEKKKIRVIVGDKKHPTPIFSEKVSYVVLNPYWRIPVGILKREIIPKTIRNINYLRKQGLVIHRTWSEHSQIINPYNIYWEQYLRKGAKFPYRIMQPPGKKNALGKIKFKFPNQFDVYLHDTPTRHLFKKDFRAFSHGCVRVGEPHSLLETIASFNKNIKMDRADKILKGKRKVQYNIKNRLPIHLVYLTAGVNSENQLEFRDDIYRYDEFMKRSIK